MCVCVRVCVANVSLRHSEETVTSFRYKARSVCAVNATASSLALPARRTTIRFYYAKQNLSLLTNKLSESLAASLGRSFADVHVSR